MFRKLFFVLSLLIISTQSMNGENLPIKNQDVSPEQLKSQNREIVKLVVAELSKDLPETIDKYTKLIDIKGVETNLIYNFELNISSKTDKQIQAEDHSRMREAITYGICRSSKRFMDAQIVITYKYTSAKSKKTLFQFDIDQAICFKLLGR